MRDTIIALDPGKTTGVACLHLPTKTFSAQQMNFIDVCKYLHHWMANSGVSTSVVAESFTITMHTAKNTQAPWSLEIIGVARYLSLAYGSEDLTLQAPSAAKRFSSDERLHAMGWWTPAKGHANDATRHLLLYLVSRGFRDDRIVV